MASFFSRLMRPAKKTRVGKPDRCRRLQFERLEARELMSAVPATPALRQPTIQSATSVLLSWADVSGETGYRLEYKPDGASTWQQGGTVGQNVTHGTIGSLRPGVKYDFGVQAFNAAGSSQLVVQQIATMPTPIATGNTLTEIMPAAGASAWYTFTIASESNVSVKLNSVRGESVVALALNVFTSSMTTLVEPTSTITSDAQDLIVLDGSHDLKVGTYYIRVTAASLAGGPARFYALSVNASADVKTDTLSGDVVSGASFIDVSIQTFGSCCPIDPKATTFVVIHGMDNGPANLNDVSQPISDAGYQVLTIDWHEGSYSALGAGAITWIQSVGAWAADVLAHYGFSGAKLNLVGHSYGAYVADNLAARMPGGIVNSIVALDPAVIGSAGANFAAHSRMSWAFVQIDARIDPFRSLTAAATAKYQFALVDPIPSPVQIKVAHGDVHTVFGMLIKEKPALFSLNYVVNGSLPQAWLPSQPTGQYAAQINELDGLFGPSLLGGTYVDAKSHQTKPF